MEVFMCRLLKTFRKKQRITFTVIFIIMLWLSSPAIAIAKTDLDVPDEVHKWSVYYSSLYGFDTELIEALIFVESSYQPKAKNGSCEGLMQVNASLHKDIMENKGITNIYDIPSNINMGCYILYEKYEECEDMTLALMYYNGNTTAATKYLETGKTNAYIEKIYDLESRLKGKYESEASGKCMGNSISEEK